MFQNFRASDPSVHTECLQVLNANGLTIRRNKFSTCDSTGDLGLTCEPGWRVLKCEGPLDSSLTGIVASLAEPLADASVPIFPIATYDTDYLLIKENHLETAIQALAGYGHAVRV